jgi:hypothetical protein
MAQKSYRNILTKDLSIQSKSINDFHKLNDAKKANSLSKTINRYFWDQTQQDWYFNNSSNVKYLSNGETEEVIERDAQGFPISKTNFFISTDGRITGNIQYNYVDGAWLQYSKMETEYNEHAVEVRNEYFSFENGNWVIVSGSKQLIEKKTPSEEITIQYFFNETDKKYEPFRKTISSFNNLVLEQNIFQEYNQNEWKNVSAEGYDYDHQKKISSVYYMVWDGVTFQNDELYTNIIWHDFVNGKFSQMELKKWDGTNFINSQKAIYQYGLQNNVIAISYEYKNNEWVYVYRISEEYDQMNNPKLYKVESFVNNDWDVLAESKVDYTYDSQNRLVESISSIFDGNSWYNFAKETILYNNRTTGINENKLSVNVYPNPSTDYFRVETKITNAASINVYSLSEKLVLSVNSSNLSEEKIDVSSLQKGMYLLEIKQGSEIYTSKLLVN